MHSPNLTQDNIARIRELFPNCVTEAKGEDGAVKLAVDFDQLRQELSWALYEIEWVQRPQGGGKRRARRPCQTAHARGEQRPLLPNKKGLACCAALYYD